MTRFPGVMAVPVMSGMPSGSCEGVWGLCCPAARDIRRLAGVAVEVRSELRWASCCAWRRIAFSCRSSLSGTLRWSAMKWRDMWAGATSVLYGCLLRRSSRRVLCGARHGGGDMPCVDDAVAGRCLLSALGRGGLHRHTPASSATHAYRLSAGRQAAPPQRCTAAPPHRHCRRRPSVTMYECRCNTIPHPRPQRAASPCTPPLLLRLVAQLCLSAHPSYPRRQQPRPIKRFALRLPPSCDVGTPRQP